jgi:hypothetical protein
MESKISDLTTKIEQASSELAHAHVGQVIGDVIKVLSVSTISKPLR